MAPTSRIRDDEAKARALAFLADRLPEQLLERALKAAEGIKVDSAPQPDLQADGEDRPIAQAGDGIFGRGVEHLARLRFREGEGRAFVPIDRRPLDLADR